MARHRAGRTEGTVPLITFVPRALRHDDARDQLFVESGGSADGSGLSVSRAMEILERIADRRDQWAASSVPLADRVKVLP
jgi:hypothetical protein